MKKLMLLALWSVLCVGCIENDIPYPVIAGEVKQIEFEGQKEMKIDATKRQITLVLNDTVDMRSVEVLALELTAEARSTIKQGDRLDFSNGAKGTYVVSDKPYKFTVSTYQDYDWTIVVTQPLNRRIEMDGSVGAANIDTESRMAVVSVSQETDLYGVVVREFCLGPALATYSPDPFATTNYSKRVKIAVSFFGLTEEWTVEVQRSNSNVTTGAVNPWAVFAEVDGTAVASSPLTPSFEYRKKSAAEWQSAAAVRSGNKISGVLKGLSPNTDYVFRAKLGDEVASEKSFRTEATPQIENMGFEEWAQSGITWYANATAAATYWGSGNPGVTAPLAGGKPSNTAPTTDAKEGKLAAQISTIAVPVVSLAAGSLFTGDFILQMPPKELDSPKFSRPYAGRPTQLSFWYKYAPVKIDVARKKPEELGKMDRCIVYIYLGDWEGTLLSSQLAKENTPGAIAYGEFITDKAVSSYTKQTINLTYYDKKRTVKKILVVGTSSINGDFYTGGVGSTLWLDDLQFGWDPIE